RNGWEKSEALGRRELLRSVVSHIEFGQVAVLEGISYTTGHTDHVVGNFTSCSFPVVTLAQQHRTDIVRTEGPVVVDRPLQVDVVSGIGSFTKGNQLLFRTFDRVTESVIRIVDVGQEKLLRLSGLHGSGGTGIVRYHPFDTQTRGNQFTQIQFHTERRIQVRTHLITVTHAVHDFKG